MDVGGIDPGPSYVDPQLAEMSAIDQAWSDFYDSLDDDGESDGLVPLLIFLAIGAVLLC